MVNLIYRCLPTNLLLVLFLALVQVLFPFYFPELGIGQKHSVVGKPRCQTRIANLLKSNGIEGKKLAPCFYVFFSNDITEEEKKNAELEARRCAYWYDIIGD